MKVIGNRETANYLVILAPNHKKVNNKFYSLTLDTFTWKMTRTETFNITPYKIDQLKKHYKDDCDLLYVDNFKEILDNEKLMAIREAYYSHKNEEDITDINSFLDDLLNEKYESEERNFYEKTSINKQER